MGDFDNIKDKLLNYQSPIDIDEAWEELALKQENVTLKKDLQIRNIIGGTLGAGLLIIGAIWVVTSMNINLNKNTTNNTNSNNQTTILTETSTNEKPDSEKAVGLDKVSTKEELISANEMQTLEEVSTLEKTSAPQKTSTSRKAPTAEKIRTNIKPTNQILNKNAHVNASKETNNSAHSDFNDAGKQKTIPKQIPQNIQLPPQKTDNKKNDTQKTQPIASTPEPTPLIQTNKQYKTVAQLPTKQFPLIDKQTNTDLLLTTSPVPPKYKFRDGKNFVGLEILGQGGFYSLNYGRVLSRQRFGETDIQLGLSINPRKINGEPTNIYPLMSTLSVGQSFRLYKPHHLTLGLATIFASRTGLTEFLLDEAYLIVTPKLGYKYRAPGSRISYKAEVIFYREYSNASVGETSSLSTHLTKGPLWGGIGVGYNF